jgi:copper resistance protein B
VTRRIVWLLLLGTAGAAAAAPDHQHPGTEAAPPPGPVEQEGMGHGTVDHGTMEHGTMEHAGPDHGAMGHAAATGPAAAPPPPAGHYADRDYPPALMERARARMMAEQGGQILHRVLVDIAEWQPRKDGDGFRWHGEARVGGDINRLAVKSEGEGSFGEGTSHAEAQALFSRAVSPYFDLQAGIRHEFAPGPPVTSLAVGFEGLAPLMIDVEGAAFVSDGGDVVFRLAAFHDWRITQRLIAEPRAELNFAAADQRERRIGHGLSSTTLDFRLRYEIRREFAPYVGVSWQSRSGRTADFAREAGHATSTPSFVAGLRVWF